MRKLFKRLASYLVIWYANKLFWRGVKAADERHEKEGGMIYLTASIVNPRNLVTYNRKQFRTMRMKCIDPRDYSLHRLQTLKDGAFYHTADGSGKYGLSDIQVQARRYGFIDLLLYRAKLIDYSPENF